MSFFTYLWFEFGSFQDEFRWPCYNCTIEGSQNTDSMVTNATFKIKDIPCTLLVITSTQLQPRSRPPPPPWLHLKHFIENGPHSLKKVLIELLLRNTLLLYEGVCTTYQINVFKGVHISDWICQFHFLVSVWNLRGSCVRTTFHCYPFSSPWDFVITHSVSE